MNRFKRTVNDVVKGEFISPDTTKEEKIELPNEEIKEEVKKKGRKKKGA